MEWLKNIFYLNRGNSGLGFIMPLMLFVMLSFTTFIFSLIVNSITLFITSIILALIIIYLIFKRIYTIDWKNLLFDDYGVFVGFIILPKLISLIMNFSIQGIIKFITSSIYSLLFFGSPKKKYVEKSPKFIKMEKEQQDMIKKMEEIRNQPFEEPTFTIDNKG